VHSPPELAARPPGLREGSISIDPERFREVERPAAYEMANAILAINNRLQARLGLRAEETQVFLTIAVATVQRFARSPAPDPYLLTRAPLPLEMAGHVSRRRIAESLGLPLETVRRHVARLIARGLVIETGRGRLSTPSGTLARVGEDGTPYAIAGHFLAVARAFARLGLLGRP
jgi:biotin operon repressor